MNITGLFRQFANTFKNEIRTCIPAQVESFDPEKLTVNVKPLIKGIKIGSEREVQIDTGEELIVDDYSLPSIVSVPVSMLWFGNGGITMPINPGAQGLLMVCDRDIRLFKQNRTESAQASLRRFNMNDSSFLPFLPKPVELTNYNNEAVEVRYDETLLQVDGSGVNITGNVNITGTLTTTGDAEIAGVDFITHTHTYSPGPLPPAETAPPTETP